MSGGYGVGENRARHTDPATAHAAAAASSTYREKVDDVIVKCLAEHGRHSTLEVSEITGLKHNNISSRFIRLEQAGKIRRAGVSEPHPITRRRSTLWELVPSIPEQRQLL